MPRLKNKDMRVAFCNFCREKTHMIPRKEVPKGELLMIVGVCRECGRKMTTITSGKKCE